MGTNPEAFVRGLAGALVLVGVALAWLVNSWWLLLPAFVAVNLLQSAFTGFCPAAIFFRWSRSRTKPADVAERVRSGAAVLIDVREPDEWEGGVAEKAVLLPLSDLRGPRHQWREFLARAGQRELALYCGAGMRASAAAQILVAEGLNAKNTGGLRDWAAHGWPIVPPRA